MQRLLKATPFLLACILVLVVYRFAVQDSPHITAQTLQRLQANNPDSEVAMVSNGNMLQYEAYGKPAAHQFRIQAFAPGTVEFCNADGKTVMKMFVEQGDVLITEPKKQRIEAYVFQPFEWLE